MRKTYLISPICGFAFFLLGIAVTFFILPAVANSAEPEDTGKTMTISSVIDSADAHVGKVVVREAYRRIGYEVTYTDLLGAEALRQSSQGEVDAELQRIDGIDRFYPDLLQVSIPINYLQGVAFTNMDEVKVTGWHSLKPYRIGIVKGIIFAEEGTKGMNVTSYNSYHELLKNLNKREVDIAVMPGISGKLAIKQDKYTNIRQVGVILETLFLYHYVHRKHAALVPLLEKELKAMLLDGYTRHTRQNMYDQLLQGKVSLNVE